MSAEAINDADRSPDGFALRRPWISKGVPSGNFPPKGDSDNRWGSGTIPFFSYYFVTSALVNTLIDKMIKNVETIRNTHKGFWFSPDTMRFFRSRIEDDGNVYGGKFFITSERAAYGERAYTVREYDLVRDEISTVGEFMGYATLEDAISRAKELGR